MSSDSNKKDREKNKIKVKDKKKTPETEAAKEKKTSGKETPESKAKNIDPGKPNEENGVDNTDETAEEESHGRGFVFYVMLIMGGLIVLCLVLFLGATGIAIAGGGSGDAAAFISIVRDLFIILLTLQAMIICIALIVMVLQLSALMNVLENEIKPIVQNINETTSTMRGTAEFVSTNVTRPVVRAHSFVSGALAIMREVSGIRRALRNAADSETEEDNALTTHDKSSPEKTDTSTETDKKS